MSKASSADRIPSGRWNIDLAGGRTSAPSSLRSADASPRLGPVVEAHDDENEGYHRAVAVLRAHAELRGIYVSTVNSLPVLRAAEQEGVHEQDDPVPEALEDAGRERLRDERGERLGHDE